MTSYLNQYLADKLPESTEIELHLFEFCNLSCAFCGQDHDSKQGMSMDSIMGKAKTVIEWIDQQSHTSHIVNLMGGEIFNDLVPDEMFDAYRAFHRRVYQHVKAKGHTVRFNWVTNLIFFKRDRVQQLIEDLEDSWISTSYDFAGRGLDLNRRESFRRNLDHFGDRITVIGFVLTRPAIRKLLAGSDHYFKYLYAKYPLYFDYYVPELSADKLLPSDQEQLDAYTHIAEYYPKVQPVKDWLENSENRMTCYSLNKLTLLPSGREVKCRYMDYKPTDFETPIDYLSNENIIESHLARHDCMSCPHFQRCTLTCFVQADYSTKDRMDECLMRVFFDQHPLP